MTEYIDYLIDKANKKSEEIDILIENMRKNNSEFSERMNKDIQFLNKTKGSNFKTRTTLVDGIWISEIVDD